MGDQQLWVRAVLPQQLLALTSFSCPEHPSFTGTQTRKTAQSTSASPAPPARRRDPEGVTWVL